MRGELDAATFNAALERIGITQAALARLLRRHKATTNRWAQGHAPIPYEVAIVLAVLDKTDLTAGDLEDLAIDL